jgi:hypothetical protein
MKLPVLCPKFPTFASLCHLELLFASLLGFAPFLELLTVLTRIPADPLLSSAILFLV